MRTNHWIPGLLIALACAALIAGCQGVGGGLRFSHKLHADEASCADCHGAEKDTMRTGMEPCKACHEIDTDKPGEACLTCHTVGEKKDYAVKAPAKGANWSDVTFAHDVHDAVACATCHGDVGQATALGGRFLPTMADCAACHDGDEAPAECDTCHQTLRADAPPPSHTPLWAKSHGYGPESSCAYCHEGTDPCASCHRQTQPESHTAGWKFKSHGLQARHDRQNCAACHSASYCSECHLTPPRDHRPATAWLATGHGRRGAVDRETCLVCHTTAEATCRHCHTNGF